MLTMMRFIVASMVFAPVVRGVTIPSSAYHVIKRLLHDNGAFVAQHGDGYFDAFRDGQKPVITLLACSDARFQPNDIDTSPDGEVFTVRNIGNQIVNNQGSVEYGVRHLDTPLLLIVGHVACGAIKAALENYEIESPAMRRELDGLHLPLRALNANVDFQERWGAGILANVNSQVGEALREYAPEVKSGKLTVVGAVYDFRNDLGQGKGRLIIVNVNGISDTAELRRTLGDMSDQALPLH